jgi:hypothetical protein
MIEVEAQVVLLVAPLLSTTPFLLGSPREEPVRLAPFCAMLSEFLIEVARIEEPVHLVVDRIAVYVSWKRSYTGRATRCARGTTTPAASTYSPLFVHDRSGSAPS